MEQEKGKESKGLSKKLSLSTMTTNKVRTSIMHGAADDDESLGSARSEAAALPEEATTEPKKQRKRSGGSGKTFVDMAHDAIVAMGDRTGSSLPAITKYIQCNHPDTIGQRPVAQFRKLLNAALKSGLSKKRFTKVKASYKINTEWKAKEKAKQIKKMAHKKRAPATDPEEGTAQSLDNAQSAKRSPSELAREKAKVERDAQEERRRKERAERLRRRRFPMEDTKLHAEDKELSVKPPLDVISRPYLPYFWQLTRPLSDPGRMGGKTQSSVLANSKVDGLDVGNRGLVPDLLTVYHFFVGDVSFPKIYDPEQLSRPIVPEFSLSHLVFSTEQIIIGHSKASRMLPPLLVHLFCTSLSILCQAVPDDSTLNGNERQLRNDLTKYLLPALTPASWPDILVLYIDAMERYYTSDSSLDKNVLPGLNIDIEYLLNVSDEAVVPMTPFPSRDGSPDDVVLPDGYSGYLGDSRGVLYRAYYKLQKQEVWTLSAEEIMALLRTLTDDILATYPAVGQDMARRDEEMQFLLKAKRAADNNLRKARLGFEGPKKQQSKRSSEDDTVNKVEEENCLSMTEKNAVKTDITKDEGSKTFKPTISRKQFDSARRAQQKANDAYEKAIHSLVARTVPLGYDRNYNAVYCFRHDPEVLYVEDLRSPAPSTTINIPSELHLPRRSWHVIETSSLFDVFTQSLDIRGKREYDLYEELLGPPGGQHSLRRFLSDDLGQEAKEKAQQKELANIQERLEMATKKCDEEKRRRSGRLVGQAEEELANVKAEMKAFERNLEENLMKAHDTRDYIESTGLFLLRQFDSKAKKDTRRTREQKAVSLGAQVPAFQCSKLMSTGNIDGTGVIGVLVSDLLHLEEQCETLVPWEIDRKAWITQLENAVLAWNAAGPVLIGSPDLRNMNANLRSSAVGHPSSGSSKQPRRDSLSTDNSSSKRRRSEPPSSTASPISSLQSSSALLFMIKHPLLALENRVADLTNISGAALDSKIADDNMSTTGDEADAANEMRLERAWKKQAFDNLPSKVYHIRSIPAAWHVQIREKMVSAIAAARKAHLPDVVAKLRAVLLLYHPSDAGDCKDAALKLLESLGGYQEDDESDEDDEGTDYKENASNEQYPSVIAAEAAILASSLSGSDDAGRKDWVDAVNSAKTVARLSCLAAGFVHEAEAKVRKLKEERDALRKALSIWEKEDQRNKRSKKQTDKQVYAAPPSEVWASVTYSDEFVMVKGSDYPWWPAKKCEARDDGVSESLSKLNRSLVALIGEMGGLRVVKNEDIKPFTGDLIVEYEDNEQSEFPKDMRNQLEDCMAMARRILRGKEKLAKREQDDAEGVTANECVG